MPRNFRLPSAMPSTHTKASTPTACAMGCVLWSSKSQLMRQAFGRRGLHLGARAGGVGLEVLVEEAGELLRGGVVGGFVGPGVARDQDFRRHAGTLGDDVEAEDRIALRSSPLRARRRGSRR